MKDSKTELIDEITRNGDGMTVPAGYFEDFAVKMSGRLPFREELDTPVANQASRHTIWTRMRPYVYMAAMFAGAWCLLKMFSLMSNNNVDVNIDNYPALSRALENEQFIDDYIIDCVSSYDIMEDSYNDNIENVTNEPAPQFADERTNADGDNTHSYILPTDGDYSNGPTIDLE